MADYKDYKSVTEFPLHTEDLNREQLEAAYRELRDSYRSLVTSRGQLVRRQTEAKKNLADISQKLKQLRQVEQEKQQLQKSLIHSVEIQKQLEQWGNNLAVHVDELEAQIRTTTQLMGEFESVYNEVQQEKGILSIWQRFSRLLSAANRLLNTDISTLMPQKRAEVEPDDWTQETPANINRSDS